MIQNNHSQDIKLLLQFIINKPVLENNKEKLISSYKDYKKEFSINV